MDAGRPLRAKWDDCGPRETFLVNNYGKLTQAEIAKKLKLRKDQVRKWAHFLGLHSPRASKPLPPGLLEAMLADWEHLEIEELAAKYGVSRECAWSRIRLAKRKKLTEHRKRVAAVFATVAAMCGHGEQHGGTAKTKSRNKKRSRRGQHRTRTRA